MFGFFAIQDNDWYTGRDLASKALVISTRRSNRRRGLYVLHPPLHNGMWSTQIHLGHKKKLLKHLALVYEVLII